MMRIQPYFLFPVLVLLAAPARAQAPEPIAVPFLNAAPTIDGRPDAGLAGLDSRTLALEQREGDEAAAGSRAVIPRYRLAYGTNFLYVLVEIDTPRLAQRDRAYQNGDGVVLVVARPQTAAPGDAPTREFYVLGFSPGTPAARWQQKFVWYRNVDLEMRPLDQTTMATGSSGGRSFFEILIPWREVYPYHPWLSDAIGFNICVTRALDGDRSARYCAVDDRRVGSEQSPRRYARLAFEPAAAAEPLQAFGTLDRNWLPHGGVSRLSLVTLAPRSTRLPLIVRAWTGEGTRAASRQVLVDVPAGSGRHEIEVPTATLPTGGYSVTWDLGDGAASGALGLSVLPAVEVRALSDRLDAVRSRLRPGSYTTLKFRQEEIERQQQALRPYDTAFALRVALEQFAADVRSAEGGGDPVAGLHGVFRRAFRSAVDGKLQPYSVKVPAGYDASRRYPLMVFLHGSGQDDRNELSRDWFPRDCILLAPFARGTSNWFTADNAQQDIREAIDDVRANYSVDESRVVLAGFSMGGYGVYRTFKENPSRFAALAVFSGLPRVPGGSGLDAPDFLEKEDLAPFARVPMFVFHGGKDRNCPIEQTRALVERLKQAGVNVHFEYEADKGHEAPGEAALKAFQEWFQKIVGPVRTLEN